MRGRCIAQMAFTELLARYPIQEIPRAYLGRDRDEGSSLRLADAAGHNRIVLRVAEDGTAEMQFLDASGKVTSQWPAKWAARGVRISGAADAAGLVGIFVRCLAKLADYPLGFTRCGSGFTRCGSGFTRCGSGLDCECDGVVDLAAAVAAVGLADLCIDGVDRLAKGPQAQGAVDEHVVGLKGHAAFEVDPQRGGAAQGVKRGVPKATPQVARTDTKPCVFQLPLL